MMFFKFLHISFQMKNNDDMWLRLKQGQQNEPIYPLRFARAWHFKDTDSTALKRGSVFIGLMTPDGAIILWSRYQRAVLIR